MALTAGWWVVPATWHAVQGRRRLAAGDLDAAVAHAIRYTTLRGGVEPILLEEIAAAFVIRDLGDPDYVASDVLAAAASSRRPDVRQAIRAVATRPLEGVSRGAAELAVDASSALARVGDDAARERLEEVLVDPPARWVSHDAARGLLDAGADADGEMLRWAQRVIAYAIAKNDGRPDDQHLVGDLIDDEVAVDVLAELGEPPWDLESLLAWASVNDDLGRWLEVVDMAAAFGARSEDHRAASIAALTPLRDHAAPRVALGTRCALFLLGEESAGDELRRFLREPPAAGIDPGDHERLAFLAATALDEADDPTGLAVLERMLERDPSERLLEYLAVKRRPRRPDLVLPILRAELAVPGHGRASFEASLRWDFDAPTWIALAGEVGEEADLALLLPLLAAGSDTRSEAAAAILRLIERRRSPEPPPPGRGRWGIRWR